MPQKFSEGIIVAGCHRSGTSPLTRVLNILGFQLPAELLPPVENNNETGFWEPVECVSINTKAMNSVGLAWDSLEPFPQHWSHSSGSEDTRRRIKSFLKRNFQDTPLFLMKDPRICLMLDVWQEELVEFGAQPKVVIPLRHPSEVAASLLRRDNIPTGAGVMIWLRHVLAAELASRSVSRFIVEYGEVLKDWRSTMSQLGESLELKWPVNLVHASQEIERFLRPGLRHHDSGDTGHLPELVAQAFASLRLLAVDPNDSRALDSLDQIRASLAESDELYVSGLAHQSTKIRAEREKREALTEQLESGATESRQRVTHLEHQLEEVRQQLTQQQQSFSDREKDLQSKAEHAATQLAVAVEKLQQTSEQQKVLQQAHAESEQNVSALKQQYETAETQRAEFAARVDTIQLEQERLMAERDQWIERCESTESQLENDIAQLKTELEHTAKHHRVALETANKHHQTASEKALEQHQGEMEAALEQQQERYQAFRADSDRQAAKIAALKTSNQDLQRQLSGLQTEFGGQLAGRKYVDQQMLALTSQLQNKEREMERLLAKQHPAVSSNTHLVPRPDNSFSVPQRHRPLSLAERLVQGVVSDLRYPGLEREKELVLESGLFDAAHYARQLDIPPDVALDHYLGASASGTVQADPHPLFSESYYTGQLGNGTKRYQGSFLSHYILRGAEKLIDPHPLIHSAFLRQQLQAESQLSVLQQYLRCEPAESPDPHPLFDHGYYLDSNPDIATAGVNPLIHFLQFGANEGRNPHPLFDTRYYLDSNPDVKSSETNGLIHFDVFGAFEGRNPHPLFDVALYLEKVPGALEDNPLIHFLCGGWRDFPAPCRVFDPSYYTAQAGLESLTNPLLHFAKAGWRLGFRPHPLFDPRFVDMPVDEASDPLAYFVKTDGAVSPSALVDIERTKASTKQASGLEAFEMLAGEDVDSTWTCHCLFDAKYYLRQAQRVGQSRINPWIHYLEHGAKAGLCPHPFFNPSHYAQQIGKPISSGVSLEHFLSNKSAVQTPHPLFDPNWFRQQSNLKTMSAANALKVYVSDSNYWRYCPHPLFDAEYYLGRYRDVRDSQLNPLLHYLTHGWREDRAPNSLFDPGFYRDQYLSPISGDPLLHYLAFGCRMGKDPGPRFDANTYIARDLAGHAEDPLTHWVKQCTSQSRPLEAYPPDGRRRLKLGEIDAIHYELQAKDSEKHAILVVAHVAGKKIFGGERSFADMCAGLNEVGFSVHAVLPQDQQAYIKLLSDACVTITTMPYDWWRQGKPVEVEIQEGFAALIDLLKPTAVHVNTIMLREPLLAAREQDIPAVVHIREIIQHDVALRDLIGLEAKEIIQRVHSNADWVIANSQTTARSFDADKTFVVNNVVDTDRFDVENTLSAGMIRVGLISSNIEKKGLRDFFALAKLCEPEIPNMSFSVIGPETPLLLELLTTAPSNLSYLGYFEKSLDAIQAVNIVLSISHFAESFGRTVVEGLAARRPAIVYDYGTPPTLIQDGKTGFSVPWKDYQAIAPILKTLAGDCNLIAAMGTAGRRDVESRFSFEVYQQELKAAYGKIIPDLEAKSSVQILPAAERFDAIVGPLRIAYFLWHFPVPSETFVLNELRELVRAGHDVCVFCRQSPYPDFRPDFEVRWVNVADASELAAKLRETDRQIVHSHFVFPTVTSMVWPACESIGLPFTFICHAQDIFRYENDKNNRIAEIVDSDLCLRVLVPGKFHFNYLTERNVDCRKIIIHPQGIESERYGFDALQPREVRRFCAIHRFTEKKGLHYLLEAMRDPRLKNIEVNLYGYGPQEDELKSMAAEFGLSNVAFPGGIDGRASLISTLREHDAFLCPSVRAADGDMDGIPTIVMESMAVGTPVITTNVSSIPDIVTEGLTGYVCGPEDPSALCDAILRCMSASSYTRQRIVERARSVIEAGTNAGTLCRRLERMWRRSALDIIIVSWNNIPELKEVIARIIEHTTSEYHLIICDNQSQAPVPAFLDDLHAERKNVTVIHNDRNAMVGPGTNRAMANGRGDYAIYVCGKEGMALQHGWERQFTDYFDEHPEVGLAGTCCYSPTYLTGEGYTKLELFSKFRNPSFATDNPDREFCHVQGGLFGIRRTMFEDIGGFSEAVPHAMTDVEYSYYVESCGWKLGEMPGIISLYNKTRPTLFARIEESIKSVHPPTLEQLPLLDSIAAGCTRFCPVCEWSGEEFDGHGECPQCGSAGHHRQLLRWLAESTLTYRRLPALWVGPHDCLLEFWQKNFQGRQLSLAELALEIDEKGQVNHKSASLELIVLDAENLSADTQSNKIIEECARILNKDGYLLVAQHESTNSELVNQVKNRFSMVGRPNYCSAVIEYGDAVLLQFQLSTSVVH
ncbi:MAG: glycosyltransferase [Lysobacterales bacterium]